jgi:hypothetical protein
MVGRRRRLEITRFSSQFVRYENKISASRSLAELRFWLQSHSKSNKDAVGNTESQNSYKSQISWSATTGVITLCAPAMQIMSTMLLITPQCPYITSTAFSSLSLILSSPLTSAFSLARFSINACSSASSFSVTAFGSILTLHSPPAA